MGGDERATTGADDVVVSDGEAVDMNIQVNELVSEAEKDRIIYGNSEGSLEDGSLAYKSGNSAGSSGDGFRTYKRRKCAQAALDGKVSGNTATRNEEKSTEELPDNLANKDACRHASVAATSSHVIMNTSYDSSVKQWRNVVLQQICESLDDEAGLAKCIRDALVLCPESGCTSVVKESIHSCEDGRKCTSLSGPGYPQFQNEARYNENLMLNKSVNDTNNRNVTELCQQAFLDVIMCEKFSILCNLLLENFQGMRVDKFFDIGRINSRMKEGTYESSPVHFLSDIQQFWIKLQKIGSDIVALSNNLSEKSRAAYQEQVRGLRLGTSHDDAVEFVTQESDMPSKLEQTEACGTYKSFTCNCCNGKTDGRDCLVCDSCEAMYHVSCIEPAVREIPPRSWYCASCTGKCKCGKVEQTAACGTYKSFTCKCCNGKTDGRDCLVCDSCEAMYHVSCIEPAVKEIPPRSWYCASCTGKGQSPHDNCVICETINASRSFSTMDEINQFTNAETSMELEESSNGLMEDDLQLSKKCKEDTRCCNVCRTDVHSGEKFKKCGHGLCPHKFYHARCLTTKELKSYGSCWYCPSCLCRVCLTDDDDENIVLCDTCDHAYHIYCMQPPRKEIPKGKWFCPSCYEDIRRIRKAKRKYEKSQNKRRKQSGEGKASHDGRLGGKGKKQEPLDKSGGVDMLLNAAKTLNYEENLAAMGRKS